MTEKSRRPEEPQLVPLYKVLRHINMPDDFKPVTLENSKGVRSTVYTAEDLQKALERDYKIFDEELEQSPIREVVSRNKERITPPTESRISKEV